MVVALLTAQQAATVARLLDENWRGAYDILVTAAGEDFGAADTASLVEPNFVATASGSGISVDQLERIRALADVDVAAPVGMVGTLRNVGLSPILWVQDSGDAGTVLDPAPTLARISVTVTLADGRDLARNQGYVLMRARSQAEVEALERAEATDPPAADGYPAGFLPVSDSHGNWLPLGSLPDFPAPVIAVDPLAEAALFGGDRAAALTPLIHAEEDRELADSEWPQLIDSDQFTAQWAELSRASRGPDLGLVAVPMVVAEAPPDSVSMDIQIETSAIEIDELSGNGQALEESLASVSFEPWASVQLDISGVRSPFSTPDLAALWPGSAPLLGEGAVAFAAPPTELQPMVVGRPSYAAGELEDTPAFEILPGEVVNASGLATDHHVAPGQGTDPDVGQVRAYREAVEAGGPGFAAALPAPVGTFDPEVFTDSDADAVSYVPSGIYGASDTVVRATGEPVVANMSGVDFITPAPGAFTDLAGGAALRGEAPIDAVRVRVAGVDDYSPENQARVAAVAEEITALGLTARVVAGSSPQEVSLYVPDYYMNPADNPRGDSADLGWVSQAWTTLGATVVVRSAMDTTTVALASAALAAVALGALLTIGMSLRGRRVEVGVLNAVGWRRSRMTLSFLGREIPHALVLAAAIVAVGLVSTGTPRTVLITVSAAVIVAGLASALAPLFLRAHRETAVRPRSRAIGHTQRAESAPRVPVSARGLAARLTRRRPGALLLNVTALAGLAVVAGAGVTAVGTAMEQAGATRLADVARSATITLTVVLAVLGVLAAALLTAIGRRIDLRHKARQRRALRTIGYTMTWQRRIGRREDGFTFGLVAFVTAAIAALFLARGEPLAAAAAVATVVLAITILSLVRAQPDQDNR